MCQREDRPLTVQTPSGSYHRRDHWDRGIRCRTGRVRNHRSHTTPILDRIDPKLGGPTPWNSVCTGTTEGEGKKDVHLERKTWCRPRPRREKDWGDVCCVRTQGSSLCRSARRPTRVVTGSEAKGDGPTLGVSLCYTHPSFLVYKVIWVESTPRECSVCDLVHYRPTHLLLYPKRRSLSVTSRTGTVYGTLTGTLVEDTGIKGKDTSPLLPS